MKQQLATWTDVSANFSDLWQAKKLVVMGLFSYIVGLFWYIVVLHWVYYWLLRISRSRRREWVENFLGSEDYKFGDISRKFATNFTGKENYEFGDISKKLVDNIFGKRKRGNPNKDK